MKLRATFIFLALIAIAPAVLRAQQIIPPNSRMTVKLLAPLSTKTSKVGDKISAQVVSPTALQGDFVGGTVREVKNGGKIHGKSVLNFTFDTLYHQGKAIPIASNVVSLMNSRGQENVDEEGEVVKKKNNISKIGLATAGGGLLGGILGGWKGAAIGAAVGLAASAVLVETMAKGPSIDFAPGSEFVLSVKQRRGKIESASSPLPPSSAVAIQAPIISSISPISSPRDSITIVGAGFGENPQTVALGDGSVDTVASPNSPWLSIIQNLRTAPNGTVVSRGWGAGTLRGTDRNTIGVNLVKWTDTEIVLNGFGPALKPGGLWNLQPGDTLTFLICGPNNHCGMGYAVSTATPQSGGASYTVTVQSSAVGYSGQLLRADIQAAVRSGKTSIQLPPGKFYLYGMATGGGAQSSAFAIQPYVNASDESGVISAALSYGTTPSNNFTTNTAYYVVGGASVNGSWKDVKTYYASNSQPGASDASVSFRVVTNALVVVVGLASSQQNVSLDGVPGLAVDASSSGPGATEGMVIAHAYVSPGNYTLIEHSAALAPGQYPAHMADLVGVFVFEQE